MHVIKHYTVEVDSDELEDCGLTNSQRDAKAYAYENAGLPGCLEYDTEVFLEDVEVTGEPLKNVRKGIGSY